MSNIKSFESFNEEKKENWIKDAIKKPGALKKSLGKGKDEKISKAEIEKELSKLKKKDKDKEKPGTQLNKADATKKRRLELAKTLKKVNENRENCPDCGARTYYEDVLGVNKCNECEWDEAADEPVSESDIIDKIYELAKHYPYEEDMRSALEDIRELIEEFRSR